MITTLRATAAFLLTAAALWGQSAWSNAKLEDVEFEARVVRDLEQIEALVGGDLDKDFVLVELRVRPLYGTKLTFSRDDFLMRCRYDNDTSNAQSPERIAGTAVLALDQTTKGGGFFRQAAQVPVIGTPGGSGQARVESLGRGQEGGTGAVAQSEVELTLETADTETLIGRLARLELPLTQTDDDIQGYLYFQINPKRKLKHLELSYEGRFGEFRLQFSK